MRRERNKMSDDPLDSPTDDVSKNDLIGWIEKPFLSREEMWMREIAEMQKTNHNLLMRVKEQSEEIQKLKKKIENGSNYNFVNTDTGEEFEEFFTISGREEFLRDNPNIQQLPSLFGLYLHLELVIELKMMVDGKRICLRWLKHTLDSPLARKVWKSSIKDINTRNVLKKHGVV